MDLLALIMALTVTQEQAQEVLSAYIDAHPESVIDVPVATMEEFKEYFGFDDEQEGEQE
jgi:hypothetical protein